MTQPQLLKGSRPQYSRLADLIRDQIRAGEIRKGALLESPRQLAQRHGVQSRVASRALSRLAEEGWIRPCTGDRFEVSSPEPVKGVLLSWDPAGLTFGEEGKSDVRVVSKVVTTLPANLLKVFEVHGREGARAFRISKLHLVDSSPVALETVIVPCESLPGLLMKDHRRINLYRLCEQDYGVSILRVEQRHFIRPLKEEEAKLLQAETGFPALCLDRTVMGTKGPLAEENWVSPGGRCRWTETAFSRSRGSRDG